MRWLLFYDDIFNLLKASARLLQQNAPARRRIRCVRQRDFFGCFLGHKKVTGEVIWAGSAWDGSSVYTKKTQEQNADGTYITVTADFRKYPCVENSVADHSAYLLGAMNGSKKRYEGLSGEKDYKKAIQIIKDGGYATSLSYVTNVCNIVEKWNLTQYDAAVVQDTPQEGADGSFPAVPFTVKVLVSDLNYRSCGSMAGYVKGQTGKGVFTIVEVKDGWGRLKSGAGWIYLLNSEYCTVQETTAAATPVKSVTEIAKEVIAGKWGNGADRKNSLQTAGYNYSEVQSTVNELCSVPTKKSMEEIAKEVIRGEWGNGSDRKNRLQAAGYDYSEVQSKVNALLK